MHLFIRIISESCIYDSVHRSSPSAPGLNNTNGIFLRILVNPDKRPYNISEVGLFSLGKQEFKIFFKLLHHNLARKRLFLARNKQQNRCPDIQEMMSVKKDSKCQINHIYIMYGKIKTEIFHYPCRKVSCIYYVYIITLYIVMDERLKI